MLRTIPPIEKSTRRSQNPLNFTLYDDDNNVLPESKQICVDYSYLTPENIKVTLAGAFDVFKPLREIIKANYQQEFERSTAADIESPYCCGM